MEDSTPSLMRAFMFSCTLTTLCQLVAHVFKSTYGGKSTWPKCKWYKINFSFLLINFLNVFLKILKIKLIHLIGTICAYYGTFITVFLHWVRLSNDIFVLNILLRIHVHAVLRKFLHTRIHSQTGWRQEQAAIEGEKDSIDYQILLI